MSSSYWYDGGYDYGYMDLSADGLFGGLFDGLFDGFGSLFGNLFYDDSYYGYDYYGYDYYDLDEVLSVDSQNDLGDYSVLDPLLGLLDDSSLYGDVLSVDGSSGLLDGLLGDLGFLLGDLFSGDYYDYVERKVLDACYVFDGKFCGHGAVGDDTYCFQRII